MPFKAGHIFLVGGIIMALITSVLFINVIKGQSSPKEPKKEPVRTVVVASKHLPAGTIVAPEHVKKTEWPKKLLIPGQYFESSSKLIGRTIRTDLYTGELFYKSKLTGDDSRGGMPVIIPEGHRAVSVGVNEIKGVAGFIQPGSWVDVAATFEIKAKGGKVHVTRTVLQNVMVLASAQTMIDENETIPGLDEIEEEEDADEDDKKSKKKDKKSAGDLEKERKAREKAREKAKKQARSVATITLALTPEQVEKLALIEEASSIHIALRAEGDLDIVDVPGISEDDILMGSANPFAQMDWNTSNTTSPDGTASGTPAPTQNVDDFFNLEELDAKPNSTPIDSSVSIEVIQGTTKSSIKF